MIWLGSRTRSVGGTSTGFLSGRLMRTVVRAEEVVEAEEAVVEAVEDEETDDIRN